MQRECEGNEVLGNNGQHASWLARKKRNSNVVMCSGLWKEMANPNSKAIAKNHVGPLVNPAQYTSSGLMASWGFTTHSCTSGHHLLPSWPLILRKCPSPQTLDLNYCLRYAAKWRQRKEQKRC